MHYNYFRDYDPAIGRYIQSDPLGLNPNPVSEVEELSTYAYAAGNSLIHTDPLGESIGALGRAGAAGMAACMKIRKCKEAVERAVKFCKNVECKFERHSAHHYFPGLGYCEHYSITCWEKGVGPIYRGQWPLPGRCVTHRPNGPLPDSLPPKSPQGGGDGH